MAEASLVRPPDKPKGLTRPVISSRLPKAFSQPSILRRRPLPEPNEFKQTKALLSPLKLNVEQQGHILKALKKFTNGLETAPLKKAPAFLHASSIRLEDVITFSQISSSHRSGVVKKALHALTLKMLALKQVSLTTREVRQSLTEWLAQWHDLQAKNSQLLQVHAAFWNNPEGCLSLLCEYMSGGSLQNVVDFVGSVPEEVLADVSRQVLPVLAYLHSKGGAHGQVMASQVLFSRSGAAKLGLGLGARTAALEGTRPLPSPEDDILCLGVMLVGAACGDLAACGGQTTTCCALHTALAEGCHPELTRTSSSFQDFVCKCSQRDPKSRPRAESLLAHQWLYQTQYQGARVELSELLSVANQWVIPQEYRTAGDQQLSSICKALDVLLADSPPMEPAWEWAEDLAADLGLSVEAVESRVRATLRS